MSFRVTVTATATLAAAALATCGLSYAGAAPAVQHGSTVQPNSSQQCTKLTPTFDPRSASPEQLDQHDFPPRPGGSSEAEAAWEHYVTMYESGQVTSCTGFGIPDPRLQPLAGQHP